MMMHAISSVMFIFSLTSSSAPMGCYWDGDYVNEFDGYHKTSDTQYFLSGVYSYHNSHKEDRRFQWEHCRSTESNIGPFTGSRSNNLDKTSFDSEWTESCQKYNAGDAAIYEIESWHNSRHEDREYLMKCGSLDRSEYRLSQPCSWSGYQNNYDGYLSFQCKDDGVIRGIKSVHDNHHEDRRYSFECCTLNKVSYTFSNIVGEWRSALSCPGCPKHIYKLEYGTTTSTSSTVTNTYASSLSKSVSAGFQFPGGVSAGGTVSKEDSESVSREMSSTFTTSTTKTLEVHCDKKYLYQWVMTGNESGSDGNGVFTSPSHVFFCTDDANPKCPPGKC